MKPTFEPGRNIARKVPVPELDATATVYRDLPGPRPIPGPATGDAVSGVGDEWAAILIGGVGGMPGRLSYVVAHDPNDPDALWVTEAWTGEDAHLASLSLPSVRAAIARGRPLIAGLGQRIETHPVGGHGLGPAA